MLLEVLPGKSRQLIRCQLDGIIEFTEVGMDKNDRSFEWNRVLRIARLARELESKGILNGAKLLRALAFSEETRLTRQPEEHADASWVDQEMKALIREMTGEQISPKVLQGLEHALSAYHEDRTIFLNDIPPVFVCRTCGEIVFDQAPARCPVCGARKLTFREFIPYYYLDPLTPPQALVGLRSTAQEVKLLAAGLSEEQMGWSPRPGEWAIRDLLWHLLVAQQLLAARVEKILVEENPALKSVAAWAAGIDETSSGAEILAEYLRSRETVIARLEKITPEEWYRTGNHDEFGVVTVLTQASYFIRHDESHMPQMEELRVQAVANSG